MSAFTTRLGLYKPGGGSTGLITPDEVVDVDKINGNMDLIDAFVGAPSVTSGTRPASPKGGQTVIETDTGNVIIWDAVNSYWRPVGAPYCASSAVRDAFFPNPKQGDTCYRADLATQERYYALYDATTNPQGWIIKAGWHRIADSKGQIIPPAGTTGSVFASGGSATISPDGTVSFTKAQDLFLNGLFWAKFKKYHLTLDTWNATGVTNTAWNIHFGAGGTDIVKAVSNTAVGNHYRQILIAGGATVTAASNLGNVGVFTGPGAASNGHILELDIFGIVETDKSTRSLGTTLDWDGGTGQPAVGMVSMSDPNQIAYDSIEIDFTLAAGQADGRFALYGVA